ncbi:alpha/beta-hydrolase [Martensiomyces pterosporus]|nr:alpha/beta-hydrolase [Martensiomyces pterosporus]
MPLRSSLTRATQSFVAKETLVGVHSTGTALPELTRGGDPVPKLFCFPVPKIGSSSSSSSEYDLLFGHVYLPPDFKPGTEYPVMVNAYGGPQCQLVTNAYPSSQNEALGAMSRMQAMVVVCVDGRGTPHRGLEFESAIGGSLGCVEVEDIWDSVPEKHACAALVDRTRVAIHGWSYGGYVTLRALASHPEWFKVAIAGAPVVRWDWYSAAYSERYLGVLPHSKDATGGAAASDAEQATVDAYEAASVTSVADKLPRDRNRLLVVHGWNDDNVHVAHTAELVRSLQRSWGCLESTRLSVYANERHGLRLPSSNEHFETLLTFWLFYFL